MTGIKLSTAGAVVLGTLLVIGGAGDAFAWGTVVYDGVYGAGGYTTTYYCAPPPVVYAPPPVVTRYYAPPPVYHSRAYMGYSYPAYYRTRVHDRPRYYAAPRRSI